MGHKVNNVISQPAITFRQAKPTRGEGRLFAYYLDRAAEGFFRFWLGKNAATILSEAYLHPRHDLSYQHVTFAEIDTVVIGMVSGYTAEQHKGSSDKPLTRAAGRWNVRVILGSIIFAPTLRALSADTNGDFYLQAIAVDKTHCGKGVGKALLDATESKAIAVGADRLALDVSAKNHRARRLYEQCGWTVESQWPKRLVIPGLRLFRMTKAL